MQMYCVRQSVLYRCVAELSFKCDSLVSSNCGYDETRREMKLRLNLTEKLRRFTVRHSHGQAHRSWGATKVHRFNPALWCVEINYFCRLRANSRRKNAIYPSSYLSIHFSNALHHLYPSAHLSITFFSICHDWSPAVQVFLTLAWLFVSF